MGGLHHHLFHIAKGRSMAASRGLFKRDHTTGLIFYSGKALLQQGQGSFVTVREEISNNQ